MRVWAQEQDENLIQIRKDPLAYVERARAEVARGEYSRAIYTPPRRSFLDRIFGKR